MARIMKAMHVNMHPLIRFCFIANKNVKDKLVGHYYIVSRVD